MVESADDSIGQLLRALEESGQAQNTVVVFFSDNGGVRYQARSPKPITSNRPLRAGKGHLYEGGIREPLMIRWPGVTKPGSVIEDPVSSIDFLPWICHLVNAPHGAVRLSEWKLIEFFEDERLELFHLPADPGSSATWFGTNLSGRGNCWSF